jgi:hypothetical protein
MKEVQHCKFSLFYIEKLSDNAHFNFESCFEYINTYNTLEQAQISQKEFREKTIIIPTY